MLHHFRAGTDGRRPSSGLVEAADGSLVGATRFGGSGPAGQQLGTIFKLNKDGSGYEVLRSFTGAGGDGESIFSPLTKGDGDTFYGTTSLGGDSGSGTVFTITLGGAPFLPPSIDAQPVGYTGTAGGEITLSLRVTGTPPVTYPWFFRGNPIPTATNALLTVISSAETVGSYSVRATNPGGSTNSALAYITIFVINPDRSLTLLGEPGVRHRIEFIDAFATIPQNWQTLTNITMSADRSVIHDPSFQGLEQRFYRDVTNP